MMIKRVLDLGLILHNLNNFDMKEFSGRLILQKSVYFMQVYGINLGYNFSWYVHGPYSPALARDGFSLQGIYRGMPPGSFTSKSLQSKLKDFLRFMADKKNDPDRLEILASIHFLINIYKNTSKIDVLNRVKKKQSYFTKKQCEKGWNELEKAGLI